MRYEISDWMRSEQARREALFTDLFAGRPVEHLPLEIRARDDEFSVRRHFFGENEEWLSDSLRAVELTWAMRGHTDAIPAFCADVGCGCLANAFGAAYAFLGSEQQTPGVAGRVITDLEAQIGGLTAPDPARAPWVAEGLRRMRRFAELGRGFTPQSGLDAAGGLNAAADLTGLSELLTAMLEAPEAVHRLLALVQETYLALIALEAENCGGLSQMTTTDFYLGWSPPGFKGHCSDDVSAMISPALYREFSAPYHAEVYRRYGPGGLHNCGPNPCAAAYMAGPDSPVYLDLNEVYSRADLPALREAVRGRGFLRWGSDETDPARIAADYGKFMELLAPDVVLVPTYTVRRPEDGAALYDALLPIAREWARRTEFRPFPRGEENERGQ